MASGGCRPVLPVAAPVRGTMAGGAWMGRKPQGGSRDGGVEKVALDGTVLGNDRSPPLTGLRSSGKPCSSSWRPGLLARGVVATMAGRRFVGGAGGGSGGTGHQGPGPATPVTATPGTRPSGCFFNETGLPPCEWPPLRASATGHVTIMYAAGAGSPSGTWLCVTQ